MRALQQENTRLRAQRSRLRKTLATRYDLRGLVYASDAMHERGQPRRARSRGSDAPVLITGPNGSGKEKLAEIVQANSRRKDKPFVKVNAGALPDDLLEAELFGAEAGAFTGANKLRIGRFEAAHGGTLFLDEIGNLSLAGQAKLLRVLQTGEFERLGSSGTRKADVRIVSATNADLPRAIAAGHVPRGPVLPPQRHRAAAAAAGRAARRRPAAGRALPGRRSPASTARRPRRCPTRRASTLPQYDWPGNVRELQNRIQRAKLTAADGVIRPQHLGIPPAGARGRHEPEIARDRVDPVGRPADAGGPARRRRGRGTPPPAIPSARASRRRWSTAGGVVSKAAAEMGLSRQALYRRMERLGHRAGAPPEGLTSRSPIRTAPDPGRRSSRRWRARSSGWLSRAQPPRSLLGRRLVGRRRAPRADRGLRASRGCWSPIPPTAILQAVSDGLLSFTRARVRRCASPRRTPRRGAGRAGAPLQQAGRGAAHRAQRPLPARDPARDRAGDDVDGDRPLQRRAADRLRERRRARAVRRRAQAGRRGLPRHPGRRAGRVPRQRSSARPTPSSASRTPTTATPSPGRGGRARDLPPGAALLPALACSRTSSSSSSR